MWMTKTENATSGEATFNFGSSVNGNDPFANFLLGQADSYSQPSKDTVPHLNYTNFEFYVQDDWKVTRRLTVNLGVRYSYFPSPTDSKDTLLNFDPAAYNAANAPVIVTSPNSPSGRFCGWRKCRGNLRQWPDLSNRGGLLGGQGDCAVGNLFSLRRSNQPQLQQQLGPQTRSCV